MQGNFNQFTSHSTILCQTQLILFILCIFKYVSEVVIGAPYTVTKDLMNHFKVDVVCHGQTELPLENGTQDPYAIPKTMGKFISVDSGMKKFSIFDQLIE